MGTLDIIWPVNDMRVYSRLFKGCSRGCSRILQRDLQVNKNYFKCVCQKGLQGVSVGCLRVLKHDITRVIDKDVLALALGSGNYPPCG